MHHPHNDSAMQACIEACLNCHRTCLETVTHCLEMGGPHSDPAHVRLMLDCVQICQTSADFMLRQSKHHQLTCGVCAQICELCADDCDRFDEDFMKACAQACRHCAAHCRAMAQAA